MDNLIKVREQNNGGKIYYYPENPLAFDFTTLLNQKTFTGFDLENIRKMKLFKIEVLK